MFVYEQKNYVIELNAECLKVMIDEKGEQQVTLHYNVKCSLDKYTIYLHSPPKFTFAALLSHTIKRCTTPLHVQM